MNSAQDTQAPKPASILATLVDEHLPARAAPRDADNLRPRVPYDFDAARQRPESGIEEVADRRASVGTGAETVPPAVAIDRRAAPQTRDRTESADEPRAAPATIAVTRPHEVQPRAVMEIAPRSVEASPAQEHRAPQKSREPVEPARAPASLPPAKVSTRHETVIERRASAEREEFAPQGVRAKQARESRPEPHGLRPRLESLPPPAPLRARPAEPVIEIHIGRLEVRAATPSAKPAPAPRASEPDRGLANYLRGRGSGARS